MALQSLDIKRRSATSAVTPPPGVRKPIEVAKLIDVSSCIGCKACQVDVRNGTTSAMKSAPITAYTTIPST